MPGEATFADKLLTTLQVEAQVSPVDLARVPRQGAVIAVANHPFGMIEGPILGSLLPKIRPDVKIMTNFILSEFEELHKICIFVDPFGGEAAARSNIRGLRECVEWLKSGGMLVIFPAGEVAHLDLKRRQITDPPWSGTIARLARMSKAPVLPMYFRGANSPLFQLLGLVHARLRTAMLPHEFLNKQHARIELRIGNVIAAKKLEGLADEELIRYLRHRTYLLGDRGTNTRKHTNKTALEAVTAPLAANVLANEIRRLSLTHFIAESGEMKVVLARAHEIPYVLDEIGRLRELTFRETGEGTGKAIDLDRFDHYYLHLFVWNNETNEVVGAYRLGPSDEILARLGKKGLYTNTLFAYKRGFLNRIGPALEMGRSFVRREYQKNYAPLLLLWKGIGQFVVRNPQYKILFGPVSISNEYNTASRQLIVTFLKTYSQSEDLRKLVRARSPFRTRPIRALEETTVWDIEELSALIADIETDQKGVPILLKQYLKLGGKLVAFNVDPNFSDALDGLIVVDLTQTDPRVLQRYMEKDGAEAFLAYNQSARVTRVSA
jgi:putative hemolysin